MQRAQTGGDLQIRIEPVALGSLAGWLVVQVAFRHAHVVGAVQACARARPGLREHGDGGHAGCGAAGFDLQRSHKQGLFSGRNAPGMPLFGAVFLRLLIKRQQLLLRHIADGAGYLAVSGADDAVECIGGKRGVGSADLSEDVLQCLFHSRYCTASRKGAKGWCACVKKSRAIVRGSADAQTAPALSHYAWACTKLGTRNATAMVGEQSRARGLIACWTWRRQETLWALGSARHRWPLHNVYTYVKALRNVRGGSMQMLDRLGLR